MNVKCEMLFVKIRPVSCFVPPHLSHSWSGGHQLRSSTPASCSAAPSQPDDRRCCLTHMQTSSQRLIVHCFCPGNSVLPAMIWISTRPTPEFLSVTQKAQVSGVSWFLASHLSCELYFLFCFLDFLLLLEYVFYSAKCCVLHFLFFPFGVFPLFALLASSHTLWTVTLHFHLNLFFE